MHRRRVWRASSGKDWIRQNALLFRKLYEDLALGRLSSEQFALLTSGYENVHKFINRILVHELDRETNTRKIGIFYSFAGKADSGGKLASTSGRLALMSRVLPSDNTKCWGKTVHHLLWLRYLTPAKFVSGLFPDVPLF